MWKVLVVICTLGNPCTMFVEDPIKYYATEEECMIQAKSKSYDMILTLEDFGYRIDSEAHACQYVDTTKAT
jgi:hypothetical protein